MATLKVIAAAAAACLSFASAAHGAPPTFPVTVSAANGQVTVQQQPVRIVSLSATSTETLFAIGAGAQVVAVDELSNYPRRAPRTKLSGYTPNPEAISRYRPDLVVTRTDGGLVRALGKLRIPVLVLPEAGSLREAYRQVRELGRATGHASLGRAMAARMQRQVAAAVRSVGPLRRRLSIYHELTTDLYAASSRTFIGQIYRLFGLRNIADAATRGGAAYPQLSAEYILSANPDLVFLADARCCDQDLRAVAKRPGWSTLAAVERRQVIALDDDIVSRWGPRIALFVERVAAAVRRAGRGG